MNDRSDCPAQHLRRHGTYSSYRYGCRCPDARADQRRYAKQHEAGILTPRWINATGTTRRIRALCAIGWTMRDIGSLLGVSHEAVSFWTRGHQVNISTARRIAAVYDQLSMTPGPSDLARTRARARGWAPPLAWDDDTIDDSTAALDLGATPSRRGRPKVDVDDARKLLACGVRFGHVAEMFRVQPGSLTAALRRAHPHDQSDAA